MTDKKNFSETLRIDLIPDTAAPKQPEPSAKQVKKKLASPPRKIRWPRKAPPPPREPRSRYQELFQSMYDAAVIVNMQGHITDANARAEDLLQYTRDELCALQIFNIVTGSDRSLLNTLREALKEERFTLIEAYCRRKDGAFLPTEIAVNQLRFGQTYLGFFIRDTSLRKQTMARLRTAYEAVHNAATGIAIADLEGRVEYANPAFASLLGIEQPEALIGCEMRVFLDAPERADEIVKNVQDCEDTWAGVLGLKRRDGVIFQVGISAACSRNEDDEPVSIVLSFTNPESQAS